MTAPGHAPAAASWIGYWDRQKVFTREHFEKSADVLLERSRAFLALSPSDVVIDIGCGPGSLAARIAGRVRAVHCVETSRRYVEECERRFASTGNVHVHHLDPDRYTDLAFLSSAGITVAICHSVAQYYREHTDLGRLLDSLASIAKPGARFLVSDLPRGGGEARAVATQIWEGMARGYIGCVARSLIAARLSDYWRMRSAIPLRTYPRETLAEIARGRDMEALVIGARLMINGGRNHLVGRFAEPGRRAGGPGAVGG